LIASEWHRSLAEQVRLRTENGLRRVLVLLDTTEFIPTNELWRLFAAGASDVIQTLEVANPISVIEGRLMRWREVDKILEQPLVRKNLVGRSRTWILFLRQIVELARFTDSSALIIGDNGTGKELAARLIHSLDQRQEKSDLIVLDCTTIAPELAGSEFFGHEKGAFTHAIAAREGAFQLADQGTLFLDEVGELPLSLQAELLRVVQERAFKPVGGNRWREVDFRLICATNRDLETEQQEHRFRTDFYHRIATWVCRMPGLDERREDIPLLAQHFLNEHFSEDKAPELSPAVIDYLKSRHYPGNVRELRQRVLRMACRHVGSGPITLGDVPESDRNLEADLRSQQASAPDIEPAIRALLAEGLDLKSLRNQVADIARRIVIEDSRGNLQQAAGRLGVTDRSLQQFRAKENAEYCMST
jgi:transcriptional regulator with GAF, ATPase, and Fis domain